MNDAELQPTVRTIGKAGEPEGDGCAVWKSRYRRTSGWRKPEAAGVAGHLLTGGNLLEHVRAILGESGG